MILQRLWAEFVVVTSRVPMEVVSATPIFHQCWAATLIEYFVSFKRMHSEILPFHEEIAIFALVPQIDDIIGHQALLGALLNHQSPLVTRAREVVENPTAITLRG